MNSCKYNGDAYLPTIILSSHQLSLDAFAGSATHTGSKDLSTLGRTMSRFPAADRGSAVVVPLVLTTEVADPALDGEASVAVRKTWVISKPSGVGLVR